MERFLLLSQRFFALLLACFLSMGIVWTDRWLPGPFSIPSAYAQTVSTEPSFSASETEQYAEVMPYWLWVVLPRIFPEYLDDKGGYLSLGFAWEAGEKTPVGIATDRAGGIEMASLSCVACHEGGRNLSDSTSKPSSARSTSQNLQFNHERYHQFFVNCARDPRFTADYIVPAIEYNHRLSWLQKQRYRLLIPKLKNRLLAKAE
ncbi:hypothetical protein [Altericista sp. CCNU0014]|uniref:hypothetical protein n=1 Tax=Altericista sp. CCNU0014 TaxID=3082949 RepID=UPI0038514ADE